MREIKFRLWDPTDRVMREAITIINGECQYESDASIPYDEIYRYAPVMQYTGLKDSRGVEIFESDILDCGDRICKVVWHDECGQWDSVFIKYVGELNSNGIEAVNWRYKAEVIGNIYENPELLEANHETENT